MIMTRVRLLFHFVLFVPIEYSLSNHYHNSTNICFMVKIFAVLKKKLLNMTAKQAKERIFPCVLLSLILAD